MSARLAYNVWSELELTYYYLRERRSNSEEEGRWIRSSVWNKIDGEEETPLRASSLPRSKSLVVLHHLLHPITLCSLDATHSPVNKICLRTSPPGRRKAAHDKQRMLLHMGDNGQHRRFTLA